LRVLEEQEFQRLGSNKSRKIDVRIISATNRDLSQAIAEKGFRTDLYYRLNAVTIAMPPLREIPEDIPLLANHFARDFAARFSRESITVEEEAIAAMQRYAWPGNVRELANAIRRAVALSEGPSLRIYDLPPHIIQEATPSYEIEPAPSGVLLLEEVEKEHILKVLDMTDGNRSEAAQILGIHRDTLLRKLKKYGVE
ncbi:MAG TPA: sigma 54-interacting transcriptional regulator, partial [bacterium]|nr:sigma 54-interacting transcriptional regulator [bacterium]